MRSVLITGGTGTLGQALARLLLEAGTPRICIFSRDEYKQFAMKEEFPDPDKRLRWFLGDVRDKDALNRALNGVDAVVHAAAMKQVEASESNPFEAVRTNVHGAQNVIDAALEHNVARVLAVSTDKAANPETLYGATKLCAERLFLAAGAYAGSRPTRFAVVRFGNIAFSRGSVLPKWKALLSRGERVLPVTDPECTRYWITQGEAARYALQCLSSMRGGESFMPPMSAFRLGDLAQALGAGIRVVGLGTGERLHEAGSEAAPRLTVDELRGLVAQDL